MSAMLSNNKPDVTVYRDTSGAARAVPGVLIVSKRLRGIVTIANFTSDVVTIEIPTLAKDSLDTFNSGAGRKKDFDCSNMNNGAYPYRVTVGNDIAEGNSAPALIIDD